MNFSLDPDKKAKKEALIKQYAGTAVILQKRLEEAEAVILANPQFAEWITKQKEAQKQIQNTWDTIEAEMIKADIKTVKGVWGTMTIAERNNWEVDEAKLDKFYFKTVVDTKKLTDAYKLTKKSPRGAKHSITKYIVKKLK